MISLKWTENITFHKLKSSSGWSASVAAADFNKMFSKKRVTKNKAKNTKTITTFQIQHSIRFSDSFCIVFFLSCFSLLLCWLLSSLKIESLFITLFALSLEDENYLHWMMLNLMLFWIRLLMRYITLLKLLIIAFDAFNGFLTKIYFIMRVSAIHFSNLHSSFP